MRFRSSIAMLAYTTAAAALALFACSSSGDNGGKNDPPPQNTSDASSPLPAGDGGAPASCTTPVDAPTACPDPKPTYADVEPILGRRCVVCHDGHPGGPWALRDYGHVADWADTIRSELLACAMPPPDAGSAITKDEKLTILNWIRCGYPK